MEKGEKDMKLPSWVIEVRIDKLKKRDPVINANIIRKLQRRLRQAQKYEFIPKEVWDAWEV